MNPTPRLTHQLERMAHEGLYASSLYEITVRDSWHLDGVTVVKRHTLRVFNTGVAMVDGRRISDPLEVERVLTLALSSERRVLEASIPLVAVTAPLEVAPTPIPTVKLTNPLYPAFRVSLDPNQRGVAKRARAFLEGRA